MNTSWLIFALLSAIFAALVAIFGKVGLEKVDSTTATTIRAVIMTLFLIAVVGFSGKFNLVGSILSNNKAFLFIIFSGIAGALSWLFYFLALKTGPVSGVISIDKLSLVFAIILAALFLGEHMTFRSFLGIALIAVGAILVVLK